MKHSSYEHHRYWEKYQPFFPEEFRCPFPNKPPQEEWWPWKNHLVHLDRIDIRNAPFKVILVHGAGGYGRFLSPLGFMLSKQGYSWVAPDLPGYGLTTSGKETLRYQDWVDMLSDLIERESKSDTTPIVLFGLSLGGMLAYQAASLSDKVAALIATTLMDCRDPAILRRISKFEKWSDFSNVIARKFSFLFDSIKIPVSLVSKMDKMSNDPSLTKVVLKDKLGGCNFVPIKFLRTLGEIRIEVRPEEFDLPVLLIHPGADLWTPFELSEPFFDRLGGEKSLVLLENCGHAPIEEPGIDQLKNAVTTFMKSLCDKKISTV